jgi:uncharacterized protein (TIGR02145 family)
MKHLHFFIILLALSGFSLITTSCRQQNIEFPERVNDIDGNSYRTVTIGKQVWFAENLKTTRLNDGTPIVNLQGNNDWILTQEPAFCWFNNDFEKYGISYGNLYNWYAVNTGKLSPEGWHIPTTDEWDTLVKYHGNGEFSGDILKEKGTAHWVAPNESALNSFGFTALPGGYRNGVNDSGSFYGIGKHGLWWSSSQGNPTSSFGRRIDYNRSYMVTECFIKELGFSVRCVKD